MRFTFRRPSRKVRASEKSTNFLETVLGERIRLQLLGGIVVIGIIIKADDGFVVLSKVKVFTSGVVTWETPHMTVYLTAVTSWSFPVEAAIKPFDRETISLAGLVSYKLYTHTSVENRIQNDDASHVSYYRYRFNTVRSDLERELIQPDDNSCTDDCTEREKKQMEVDYYLRQQERELLAKKLPKRKMRPVRQSVSLGQQLTFWVANSLATQIQITASCVKISQHANFFIQDNVDRKALSDEVVNDYARVWDDTIYPKVRQVFGHDRDTDGDPKLYILFTKELSNFGSAGQFRGVDKHPDSEVYPLFDVHSNEKDIFYVEIPDADDIEYDKGTLAHEFQHMINFDARNDSYLLAEYTWLNEAFSGLAEYITGFGYQTYKPMRSFLTLPISLTCWATLNSRNYGGSYLFGRYLYEQFGAAAIKKMVQNIGYDGLINVENITGLDFNVIYNNWVTALCLSNTGLSYDPKYNFTTLNLRTNGFDGLKTYPNAVFSMGSNVSATFRPYDPAKIEWIEQTPNSTMTLAEITPGASPGGAVIAALKPI